MRVECSGARNRCEPRQLNVGRVGEHVFFSFPNSPKVPAAGGCAHPGIGIIPFRFRDSTFHAVRKIRTAQVNIKLESSGNSYNSLCFYTFATCDMQNKNDVRFISFSDHCSNSSHRKSKPSTWKPDEMKGHRVLKRNHARESLGNATCKPFRLE